MQILGDALAQQLESSDQLSLTRAADQYLPLPVSMTSRLEKLLSLPLLSSLSLSVIARVASHDSATLHDRDWTRIGTCHDQPGSAWYPPSHSSAPLPIDPAIRLESITKQASLDRW